MPPRSWMTRRDSWDAPAAEVPSAAPRAPVPFWDAVKAGAADSMVNVNERGHDTEWRRMLQERHRQIEAATGQHLDWSRDMQMTEFGAYQPTDDDPYSADAAVRRRAQTTLPSQDEYEQRIDALRARTPALSAIPTLDQLHDQFETRLGSIRTRSQQAGASGWTGGIGNFIGGSAGQMVDPVNLGTAVATGGLGAGRPLLVRMAAQGLANATVETLSVPERARAAAMDGGPAYTGANAVQDIVGAGVGGAAFEGFGDALRLGTRPIRQALGLHADPVVRAASAAINEGSRDLARTASVSPDPAARGWGFEMTRLRRDEAALRDAPDFDAARAALARGESPPVVEPDRDLEDLFGASDAPPVSGGVRQTQPASAGQGGDLVGADYRGRRIWSGRFDPAALETDAARFQYKADGDAQGVTGRLRGIERWDATASGKIIAFEDTDGRRFIADGHQRRGLAQGLAAQGWEDAQLDGYLFRAADGWSAGEVRVVAALKNIREGTGTIMDAAKLFREAPRALVDKSLPITGEFMHQARQLASLGDVAFRAVVNGEIPERFGAVLGEMAGDRPDLQGDLVGLLKKGQPGSAEGARALVQEAMLDDFIATEGVQQDLFGGLPREATVIARGRIREAVLSGLRSDARLSALLVRHADAIESGGNTLARDANSQRLAMDRAAGELVSRLALRSGEMGEAFQKAATEVTLGTNTPGGAAKGLIQRIRNAVKAGEALDLARAELIDPAPPSPAGLAAAQTFDVPGGPGQAAQLAVKPEDAALETGAATGGLFDDMPEDDGLDRAIEHLTACAPGRG